VDKTDLAGTATTLYQTAPTAWTRETPTLSGWYWYIDRGYGPAPVHLAVAHGRTFLDQGAVRQGRGEDNDQIGELAADLPGLWLMLADPAPCEYRAAWEDSHE
jgi:hypothetical protein